MADADISNFVGITGASAPVAKGFLELTNGDFEQAVQLFFDNPDLQHSIGSSATPPAPPAERDTSRHRGASEGDPILVGDDDDFSDDDDVRMAARDAQAAEDEAEARRLQEQEYSGGPGPEEGIRSPIRGTTETLVGGPEIAWGPGDPDIGPPPPMMGVPTRSIPRSGNRDAFTRTALDPGPERPLNAPRRHNDIWDLFQPPTDLVFKGPWDSAREEGKEDKKWILVNAQRLDDFNCHALNRDIWQDNAIKDLVKENFIFLQFTPEEAQGRDYLNFYFRDHENVESYPHVAIVDPRTGEQVKVWSGRPFPSALEFHSQLAEFLDRYSLEANSKNPVAKSKPRQPQGVDFDRMTEEEMLEMALQRSLANGGDPSAEPPRVEDPDSLTKSPRPEEKEAIAEKTEEPSRFASISSTNPHTEPEHDPAVTTRIQFRHPNGRIIRRFNAQDTVRRLFEWLKAEPMEGKEGTEFELKRMPQGQDLIEALDQTVEEAGLKQGTVMIEFLD